MLGLDRKRSGKGLVSRSQGLRRTPHCTPINRVAGEAGSASTFREEDLEDLVLSFRDQQGAKAQIRDGKDTESLKMP
jgi:hypothetical protein